MSDKIISCNNTECPYNVSHYCGYLTEGGRKPFEALVLHRLRDQYGFDTAFLHSENGKTFTEECIEAIAEPPCSATILDIGVVDKILDGVIGEQLENNCRNESYDCSTCSRNGDCPDQGVGGRPARLEIRCGIKGYLDFMYNTVWEDYPFAKTPDEVTDEDLGKIAKNLPCIRSTPDTVRQQDVYHAALKVLGKA